ncbi:hypothetical protein BD770DRAFT_321933 [Pilaira anomala]|nr:hypothetical protein BD770DRAFT_321933 [Pilaira anomala]
MPPVSSLIARGTSNVCTTPKCYSIADDIKSLVNLNVDPCSDFFQYTCTAIMDQLKKQNAEHILELLNGSFEELYERIKTDDTSYHTQDKMDIDRKNFDLVKGFYDTCMDKETINSEGAAHLFSYITEIENDIFPVTETLVPENMANMLASLELREVQAIFAILVDQSLVNREQTAMYINGAILASSIDYENVESLVSYKALLEGVLTEMLGGPLDAQESQESNFAFWSASKINSAVESFVNLEMKMSKTSILPSDSSSNYELDTAPFTLNDLKESSPSIDWDLFLTTLVSEKYVATNPPIYFQKQFVEVMDEILSDTTPETLQEYFIIRTLIHSADSFDMPSNEIYISSGYTPQYTNVFRAPSSKDPEPLSLQKECMDLTTKKFKDIIGRFFALETLVTSGTKNKVKEMTDLIHSTWLEDILPETDWVDDITKEKLIFKVVREIQKKIAYSTKPSLDWRDPSSLEEHYNGAQSNGTSFYGRSLAVNTWEKSLVWKSLETKRDIADWAKHLLVYEPNASYFPTVNTIEILIGMIQEPFFSLNYPDYLNFGGLGVIVGHEFVHSLDNRGRLFNATGNREDWIPESAIKEYDDRAQCFIDQYSNFTLTGLEDELIPLNGERVLGENIADSGGLSIAFHAYQKRIAENGGVPEKVLPGFEHLTPEQLFFVSHGFFTCATVAKSDAQALVDKAVHPALYYRNIGLFQNSVEFSKAFNCPVGSPMNPEKKCNIW